VRVVVSQYEGIEATPVLPLAAGCLVATARRDVPEHEYAIAIERAPIDRAVRELRAPEILGVSLYPWNAAYSLAVAAAAKAANPHTLIVAGGPSVPRRPERAQRFLDAHPYLDVLVFAEGELTFREILRGTPLDTIPGLATRRAFNAPGRVLDFTDTASPFLDGTFDELYARHRDRFTMVICETNRGCPFSCTFCDWSLTKKIVEFPLARVHAELEWVAARGFQHVMLADANFGIRPRDTALARHLVELRARTGAPTSFYWYLTKNDHAKNLETIEILQAGGIGTWVGLAVQDFDDGVLEAVKRDNIQTGESMKLRAICGERGIPTFNELILGLPGQTYASFTQTIATAMPALPRHDFVLFLCRLIDNSELGDPASRAEFALETRRCQWKSAAKDWDPIVDEFQEVVVGHRDMPTADWRRAYRFAFLAAAFYNLRALRVVLAHVPDVREYLETIVAAIDRAPAGSCLAELSAILDRYVSSLLDGGPFVLTSPDADGPLLVDEALMARALRRYDDFLSEVLAVSPPELAEAFREQSLVTPRWGAVAPVTATIRGERVTFTPPSYASVSTFAAFAAIHLGCIRARLDIGVVTRAAPRRQTLVVLPTSG